jgi:hypothetical protein
VERKKEKSMAHDPNNPFGEFEDDFKNTEKAAQAATPGRIPEGTYKFVLTSQEVAQRNTSEQVLSDHEVFVTPSGTKGFKLFCEVLEPESVKNAKTGEEYVTKGQVLDHVFWITKKNLPYVMRDLSTILERDLQAMGEVVSIPWAGRTFEGVVRDETYDGRVRSRIAYINGWVPPNNDKADPKKGAAKPDPKKTSTPPGKPSAPAKQSAQAGKGGAADF